MSEDTPLLTSRPSHRRGRESLGHVRADSGTSMLDRSRSRRSMIDDTRFSRPKKLIVCCDGTWMDSDNGWEEGKWGQPGSLQTPTNVTRLARAIKAEDKHKHPQIVYYQAGIGTGIGLMSHVLGGGTGLGFSENIREAYSFLANNYSSNTNHNEERGMPENADSIFLTGFSRGAYTARSLGGLIGQLGLLRKEAMPWFYEIFTDWQNAGNPAYEPVFFTHYIRQNYPAAPEKPVHVERPSSPSDIGRYMDDYRKALLAQGLTQEVKIKAVGVWDTVGALGVPVNPLLQKIFRLPSFLHHYKWTDTGIDDHIENAFHALALDEHRAPFFPAVWEKRSDGKTNLKQVWFAGAHSNVGGSYKDSSTANITLAWMMDQLSGDEQKAKADQDRGQWHARDWIEFDEDFLTREYTANQLYYVKTGQAIPEDKPFGDYSSEDLAGTHHRQQDSAPQITRRTGKQPTRRHVRTWGTGTIYNSLTFPQVLAGRRTRHPGRNHPVDYHTNNENSQTLLNDTNEYIHASVRARIDFGGRSFEADPQAGLPQKIGSYLVNMIKKLLGREGHKFYLPAHGGPLEGWELVDGHKSHRDHGNSSINPDDTSDKPREPPYWQWIGQDKLLQSTTRINEDRLGTFELKLLSNYKNIALDVEATNVGKKPTEVLKWHATHRHSSAFEHSFTI